jgi:MFS family permease
MTSATFPGWMPPYQLTEGVAVVVPQPLPQRKAPAFAILCLGFAFPRYPDRVGVDCGDWRWSVREPRRHELGIVFRALQGLFGGVMIPTVFTAAVSLFQGKQKAVAASCVSATAGLAPTLGPVIGGWITDDWSWHWLFYINIVPGMAVAALAPVFVKLDEPDLMLLKGADYLGMILMAVCLGCLDYVNGGR